jgi:hypothetical protein
MPLNIHTNVTLVASIPASKQFPKVLTIGIRAQLQTLVAHEHVGPGVLGVRVQAVALRPRHQVRDVAHLFPAQPGRATCRHKRVQAKAPRARWASSTARETRGPEDTQRLTSCEGAGGGAEPPSMRKEGEGWRKGEATVATKTRDDGTDGRLTRAHTRCLQGQAMLHDDEGHVHLKKAGPRAGHLV